MKVNAAEDEKFKILQPDMYPGKVNKDTFIAADSTRMTFGQIEGKSNEITKRSNKNIRPSGVSEEDMQFQFQDGINQTHDPEDQEKSGELLNEVNEVAGEEQGATPDYISPEVQEDVSDKSFKEALKARLKRGIAQLSGQKLLDGRVNSLDSVL